jgi:hypothetical protein
MQAQEFAERYAELDAAMTGVCEQTVVPTLLTERIALEQATLLASLDPSIDANEVESILTEAAKRGLIPLSVAVTLQ